MNKKIPACIRCCLAGARIKITYYLPSGRRVVRDECVELFLNDSHGLCNCSYSSEYNTFTLHRKNHKKQVFAKAIREEKGIKIKLKSSNVKKDKIKFESWLIQ